MIKNYLTQWETSNTLYGDIANLRCYRYVATVRMFVYDVGGHIQAPWSHGIWDVDKRWHFSREIRWLIIYTISNKYHLHVYVFNRYSIVNTCTQFKCAYNQLDSQYHKSGKIVWETYVCSRIVHAVFLYCCEPVCPE